MGRVLGVVENRLVSLWKAAGAYCVPGRGGEVSCSGKSSTGESPRGLGAMTLVRVPAAAGLSIRGMSPGMV